jgi:hypothetical protein
VNNAVHKTDESAYGQHQQYGDDAQIIVVHAVEHRHRQDHGGQGEHPFDRKIDRSHQDDERLADAENERDRRVLAHPDEIAETEEIAVDGSDDHAQQDENHHRRPRRHAPAGAGGRARRGRKMQ